MQCPLPTRGQTQPRAVMQLCIASDGLLQAGLSCLQMTPGEAATRCTACQQRPHPCLYRHWATFSLSIMQQPRSTNCKWPFTVQWPFTVSGRLHMCSCQQPCRNPASPPPARAHAQLNIIGARKSARPAKQAKAAAGRRTIRLAPRFNQRGSEQHIPARPLALAHTTLLD